jgi:hypothetical protein
MTAGFFVNRANRRHCEEQSDEAIQSFLGKPGLLRCARNDEESIRSSQ